MEVLWDMVSTNIMFVSFRHDVEDDPDDQQAIDVFNIYIDSKCTESLYISSNKPRVAREAPKARAWTQATTIAYTDSEYKHWDDSLSDLELSLTPRKDLFTPDFSAKVADGPAERVVDIDTEEFFSGHVYGEPWSTVSAHWDSAGALTAAVQTPEDTFIFEPAWRHVPAAARKTTLAYRLSDVDGDIEKRTWARCAARDPADASPVEGEAARFRRAISDEGIPTTTRTRCSLKLVADYRFYDVIGNKEELFTINYLVNLISRVNDIYARTVWQDGPDGPGFDDRGFLIKSIVILPKPTPRDPTARIRHYNEKRDSWDVEDLLASFTAVEGTKPLELCLAHLFTYQSFTNGVLGLGYIASPRVGTSGGICSAPTTTRTAATFYNTALSSAKSTYGDAVITREADIVTAHELGHNWGAPHDPNTPECSPPQAQGGPFIMHTYSLSGFDPNNKAFSPCTKRSIKKVLLAKADICFVEARSAYCGNRRVEDGEECDAGKHGDSCCDDRCRLRAGARCSAANSPCCEENTCDIRQGGRVCLRADALSCRQNALCDGQNPECPAPKAVADGKTCLDEGECQGGECVNFCERADIGLRPCICENVTESCFRCCKEPTGRCAPFRSGAHALKLHTDGRPCIHGFCNDKGSCIKRGQDVVTHLWNIIQRLDGSSFRKFMVDNLVGFVIMFSLFVWIPASCLIHKIDKERENWVKCDGWGETEGRGDLVRGLYNSSFSPSPSLLPSKAIHL